MAKIRHIDEYDMINGFWGSSVSVWFQGCEHRCKGCFNPETWNKDDKSVINRSNKDIADEILIKLEQYLPKELSFLGGDPLAEYNREDLFEIISIIKKERPQTKIAIWTGYLWDNVKDLEVMKYIDILVDGKFIIDLKIDGLKHRGSTNQRIIDVKRSLKKDLIVLKKIK